MRQFNIGTQSNTELLLVSILGLAVPTICVATNQMSIDEEAELSLSRVSPHGRCGSPLHGPACPPVRKTCTMSS